MTRTRLTREGWTDLGLAVLGREGPDGLTVAGLCAAAGKTRGSLYHHFKDIHALRVGVLERWVETHTSALIDAAERAAPQHGRSQLNTLVAALDVGVERNVRRLIARDPRLRPMLEHADTARVACLTGLYQRAFDAPAARAEALARVEYAAWLGFQYVEPPPSEAQLSALYAEFERMAEGYLSD